MYRTFTSAVTICVTLVTLGLFATPALSHEESGKCPEATQETMNIEFGPTTSEHTACIQARENIKVVTNWTRSLTNRSGASQQARSTLNLVENYQQMYGLQPRADYTAVVIGYGMGGRWLLSDTKYNQSFGTSTGNPTRATVESLINQGVDVYMCQNTMRSQNWVADDLIPGVKMVPSGVSAVVDYQMRGYRYLNP